MLIALVAGLILAAASSSTAAQLSDETLQIGGAQIEVRFEEGTFSVTPAAMRNWIAKSARAVTEYYGRFPVQHIRVVLVPLDRGRGVVFGRTFVPGPTPVIRVLVGAVASEDDLREDWVMTHEMVHLAFPSVPEKHHWIEEGIATYVEPIARVQIGDLTSAKVWRDMLDGMPHGLPGAGDRGLDNTHTWGRTYWGGAMFCLLADVEIRRHSGNKLGLRDAMRGGLAAGGNHEANWSIERVLATADKAIGSNTLERLHREMGDKPVSPDLDALWRDLGVIPHGDHVEFDDRAPDAAIRKAITRQ